MSELRREAWAGGAAYDPYVGRWSRPDGSILLMARAWAVRGRVPGAGMGGRGA